jgi:hypothetical protein
MNPSPVGAHEGVFVVIMFLFWLFCVVGGITLTLIIWCKLFSKAGYSWALGLLMLVPIANIVMCFYLAFGDWPVLQELRRLKQQNNPPGC